MAKQNSKINDSAVRFANVNGTGSALAKALFTNVTYNKKKMKLGKNIPDKTKAKMMRAIVRKSVKVSLVLSYALWLAACAGEVDDRFRGRYFDSVTKACIFIEGTKCGVYFPGATGETNFIEGTCTGSWMLKTVYMKIPESPRFGHADFQKGNTSLKFNKESNILTTESGKRTFAKQGMDFGFCK